MSDTMMSVVAIFLAAILMFIFPLISTADRSDDLSQQAVQTATNEFVDDIRSTGRLTTDKYQAFVDRLGATGNKYSINMENKTIDLNERKKTELISGSRVGENQRISQYNKQIMDQMNNNNGVYKLKEGDIFKVQVTNTNKTMSQILKNFFYRVTGGNSYTIGAEHAGIVNVNG